LLFPDRVYEKKKKFLNTRHHPEAFLKMVGQENDTYDETKLKQLLGSAKGVTTA